ncbi:ArsR/SmtB family transcription factor [Thermoanaerobacterium thermosaccharolyticum]|uniref:Putative transcriptional regulator n=1 Tax=Thermoanaerobacterium thermosaccharolyticum M0795 TaxID=698948 RepID=L0IJX7_THETR|nr:metalloregulator ArsR/SmtB family transcription factor [Thermoanaerobacterium thermosaccharolyticum]AGB18272.1 putative transcriptional regulator [Thermoanaerobacterium thermosaccharolyticum M0795]
MNINDIFKALGDENRLRIINLLSKGKLCVCDIETILMMTQSNVSRHLNKLKNVGIISSEKKSQWVYYSIDNNFVNKHKMLYEYLINSFNNIPQFITDNENFEKYKNREQSCENPSKSNYLPY